MTWSEAVARMSAHPLGRSIQDASEMSSLPYPRVRERPLMGCCRVSNPQPYLHNTVLRVIPPVQFRTLSTRIRRSPRGSLRGYRLQCLIGCERRVITLPPPPSRADKVDAMEGTRLVEGTTETVDEQPRDVRVMVDNGRSWGGERGWGRSGG